MKNDSLLLIVPAPLVHCDGRFYLEEQTYNGLRLWLENFQLVTAAYILSEADQVGLNMRAIDTLDSFERLTLIPLPDASKPFAFARSLPSVIGTIRPAISQSRYFCFMLWGLWGDWGSVASLIASCSRRDYVVWTDTVASRVLTIQAENKSGIQKIYVRMIARVTARYEKYVIGKARAGFFHGKDTYKYYSPFSRNPQLVHDIHLGPEFRISPDDLRQKREKPANSALQIVYAGRAHPDKGIMDWLETLAALKADKVKYLATWYGDGPELDKAKKFVEAHELADCVSLPGPMNDRIQLLAAIRAADIFMFCHKTPESPRCLIEALLSGTPIVGYSSYYSQDLIAIHGGGVLVPQSSKMLSDAVIRLANDRGQLADLQENAAKDGFPMTDEQVFKHRSHLLRELTNQKMD